MGRRKRRSPEQIVRKLEDADRRLAEGRGIGQVCHSADENRRPHCLRGVFMQEKNGTGGAPFPLPPHRPSLERRL